MKKIFLILTFIVSTLFSLNNKYQLSPVIGYNLAEGNLGLKNDGYFIGGLEFLVDLNTIISPEISIYFSPTAKFDNNIGETDITRVSFNGVYKYKKLKRLEPFAKLGLGFENFSTNAFNNNDALYFDTAIGSNFPLNKKWAIKIEAIYMLKPNDNHAGSFDNNLLALVGVTYTFDFSKHENKKKVVKKVIPLSVLDSDGDGITDDKDKCPYTPLKFKVDETGCPIPLDTDKDGVIDDIDKCPNTPINSKVDENGCRIILDSDGDGVIDDKDKCPNTKKGVEVDGNGCMIVKDSDGDGVTDDKDICPNTYKNDKVNSDGCPKIVNLNIQFEYGSHIVQKESIPIIDTYANFLKKYPNYSIEIIGYTDNRGSKRYNLKLSEKRAKEVAKLLILRGVNPKQISYKGMGESNPIADNNTPEGRAKNRRIEAKLTRH